MNKRVYWSISDANNLKYYRMLEASFRKFHPNDELILFGEKDIQLAKDQDIFYRATPYFTKQLMEQGYMEVCKLDADQIITGNLDHIWEGECDVAVVNNSNPREAKIYPVSVWNINPLAYVNCGFVVMKSKRFVDHWYKLCYGHNFYNYQMREQDLLNIIVQYGDYEVRRLDEGKKYHGLASKGYWPEIELRDGKLYLPQTEGWPPEGEKEIVCIHWAGGSSADKMNYKLRFKPEVVTFLDTLVQ